MSMEPVLALRASLQEYVQSHDLPDVTRQLIELAASGEEAGAASIYPALEVLPDRRPQHKKDLVDALLHATDQALVDYQLSSDELFELKRIKRVMGVGEGDLLAHGRERLSAILRDQMNQLLKDGKIDSIEALYQVALQGVFDLSYDQYCALTKPAADELVDALVAEVTADGEVTAEERLRIEKQLVALDRVYSITKAAKARLGQAGLIL